MWAPRNVGTTSIGWPDAAVRNAYISYRENQVRDRAEEEPGSSDDLYYLEPEESGNDYYREPGSHQDLPYPDRSVER